MEFVDVVHRRRMVRRYDPDRPVDRSVIDELLALALRAPSAGFSQGWHFLVLERDVERAAFWAVGADPAREPDPWLTGMRTAPVLIVVMSQRAVYERRYARADKAGLGPTRPLSERWPVPYWDVDAGMAALLILLGAVDAGLGACWFGVPTDRVDALRVEFGVPDTFVPVGVVSVGYGAPGGETSGPGAPPGPASTPRRHRRARSEVVSYGRYD